MAVFVAVFVNEPTPGLAMTDDDDRCDVAGYFTFNIVLD